MSVIIKSSNATDKNTHTPFKLKPNIGLGIAPNIEGKQSGQAKKKKKVQ